MKHMNKKLVLLILPILALTACPKEGTLAKSMDFYAYNKKESVHLYSLKFEYDENGNRVKETKNYDSDSTKHDIISYTYNENNQILEVNYSYVQNDSPVPGAGFIEKYEYNDKGLLVSYKVDYESTSVGNYSYYEYDDLNRVIKQTDQIYDKELAKVTSTYELDHQYIGDTNYLSISRYYSYISSTTKKLTNRETYTYNEDYTQEVMKSEAFKISGASDGEFYMFTEYNSNHQVLKYGAKLEGANMIDVNQDYRLYEYDGSGRLVKEQSQIVVQPYISAVCAKHEYTYKGEELKEDMCYKANAFLDDSNVTWMPDTRSVYKF